MKENLEPRLPAYLYVRPYLGWYAKKRYSFKLVFRAFQESMDAGSVGLLCKLYRLAILRIDNLNNGILL